MPTDLPIACSLSAPDLKVRLAEIAAVGRTALRSATTEGDRSVVRFERSADTRRRLESIVAAEAECCAFLDLALRYDADELVLTITAPPGAEHVGADLAAAFDATQPA